MDIHFSCNGCGRCCEGHHVPLTLTEAYHWVRRGGDLIVLVECLIEQAAPLSVAEREHQAKRAVSVRCGQQWLPVIVTFAAFNPGRCRHLLADNRCAIYAERPLVCRIYPAEINPAAAFTPALKDCAAEVWLPPQPLIYRAGLPAPELQALIEQSRAADRADKARKVAICEALGIRVAALKGEGFTAWRPDSQAWLNAYAQQGGRSDPGAQWYVQPSTARLHEIVADAGYHLGSVAGSAGAFIPLARPAAEQAV